MKQLFCAHRGVSALMPENSLPAFAAAIALGADEIELDVRLTKDARLIVSHDDTLDRISDGHGKIGDFTLDELKMLNIGAKIGWIAPFCTFEEVLRQFANRVVFNIHVKEAGDDGYMIVELRKLIERYGVQNSVYFASEAGVLEWFERKAPDIPRAAIQIPSGKMPIFDLAMEYHCSRVQFWLDMFDEALIRRLHDAGVVCNLFYADTEADYQKYFNMGVDVLLTNHMDRAAHYRTTH